MSRGTTTSADRADPGSSFLSSLPYCPSSPSSIRGTIQALSPIRPDELELPCRRLSTRCLPPLVPSGSSRAMPPVLTPQGLRVYAPPCPLPGGPLPAEPDLRGTPDRRDEDPPLRVVLVGTLRKPARSRRQEAEGLERSLSPTPTLRLAGAEPRARDGRTLARAHAETVATALGIEAPSGVCVLVNELCVLTCPTEDTSGVVAATDLRQDGHGHAGTVGHLGGMQHRPKGPHR